jgi:hypothetical protein
MIEKEYLESLHATAKAALLTAQSCLKALELVQAEADEHKWVSAETAVKALGEVISTEMLVERCKDGRFEHGKQYMTSSDGKRSNYGFSIAELKKFFKTHPAKRPPAKS